MEAWIKQICDRAVDTSNNLASAEGIFRNCYDCWITGFSRFLGLSTVMQVELWAVYDSLSIAWETGYKKGFGRM